MTPLRKRMLEALQRRNYSELTIQSYLHAVEDFARYCGKSPDRLTQEHVRYITCILRDRKLATITVIARIAALRFLFVKTLRRPYLKVDLPYPKTARRLPTVASPEEVGRLIDAAGNLLHYTILMRLYATGLRRAELCNYVRNHTVGRPSVTERTCLNHQRSLDAQQASRLLALPVT